jgi:hypothetical protein
MSVWIPPGLDSSKPITDQSALRYGINISRHSRTWCNITFFLKKRLRILLLSLLGGYYSLCIAFSCIWSIWFWEISSNRLHQSLPEIIRLNFLSSGWTHLPFVRMSALTGSDGENHLHDKQFSDCHVIRFNLFMVSSAVFVI